jgi:hypothetical protein
VVMPVVTADLVGEVGVVRDLGLAEVGEVTGDVGPPLDIV